MTRSFLAAALVAAAVLAGCSGADDAPAAAPATSSPAPPSETPSTTPSAAGDVYLALGDSLAAGYQPGGAELRDSAYPALAAARIGRDGDDLAVENLACSGESTTSFLEGGLCDYDDGSQMEQAEALLAERAGEVALVSIDIGGNDLRRCVGRELTVDASCVEDGLGTVRENLPTILSRLRAAAGPDVPVLVLGYYNPWLAASYLGEGQAELDAASDAYSALDTAITRAAKGAGAQSVPLTAAFKLDDDSPTTFGGREVPTNVAQVCTLTYICTAFDIHLTDEGAAVVARVLADAADKAGV
ncbi:SGNH/GDSL hydrolase family protein [Phycicoccus sp. CSK15P-2]|uniref:SGNH/GDSL hydrolase family protein n=1 Tax=Phycicoccus sp. CSK15P-2 TaxID=2807627 RepID=UPI00194E8BBE|nr:SGNH/GDSL hydrolase family protein [Phycicoccus sp. CSK15P-2]MBM6405616.1 SGNH/GDSL hydrolase family protein [Phycicoccus sp. CSK15P-2]